MKAGIAVALVVGLVGGCSFDSAGVTGDDDDIDASVEIPDAATLDAPTPDAGPTCETNADCEVPPTLCQLAGECNQALGRCVFPDVDCTGEGDQCNVGSCEPATGACVKVPAFESSPCGDVTTCGAFSECGGFDEMDACDETGTQSRDCTDFACSAGSCVGTARVDVAACTRDQDGVTCAATECPTVFGPCQFEEFCDHDGTQSRDCTAHTCVDAACIAAPILQEQACTRPSREGQTCHPPECGGFTDCEFSPANECDETGLRARVCTPFACESQSCEAGELFVEQVACTRDTDGDVCGEVCEIIMGTEICTDVTCTDGECPIRD